MRYMLIMQVEPEAAARAAEDLDMEQVVAVMGAYNEELQKAGVLADGGGSLRRERRVPRRLLQRTPGRHRRALRRGAGGLHRILDPRGRDPRGGRALGQEVPARPRRRSRGAPRQ